MDSSEHLAALDQCPVELSARIIGQKWTLQIVNHLIHDGALRFCELQDALGGVNPSTLSSRLKMLEEEGIVERTQLSAVPPHVEYCLTAKGESLNPVINAVRSWGNHWLCATSEVPTPIDSAPRVAGQPAMGVPIIAR